MEHQVKTLADYIAAVRRRLTVALIAFIAVFVGGVYFAYTLKPTYRSTGTILIEQPNVSADLVQTTVTTYAGEQVQLLQRRVMSSAVLAGVVQKYGLYPEIVEGDPTLASAVEVMRANTVLEPQSTRIADRSGGAAYATIAFNLSFDYTEPVTAQQVAAELADLYLRQNLQSRTNQAQLTVDFLRLDIENSRAEAAKVAEQLARFKDQHAGNLPELLNFHLQSIERTEQQLDSLDREIRESRNRQFTLETQIATTSPFGTAVDANGDPIIGTAERLAQLHNERLRLQSIYSPLHPDVIRVEREIETLMGGMSSGAPPATSAAALRVELDGILSELQQARQNYTEDHPNVVRLSRRAAALEQQLAQAQAGGGSQRPSLQTLAERDPVVQQLRQQLQTEQTYLVSLQRRRAELEGKLDELRGRVAAMPQIEREYEVLNRQNELSLQRYNDAVRQLDTAERAQTLELEGGGERFELLEAPSLPLRAYKPNRKAILLVVLVVALGIGIGLAALVDTLDPSVKDSNDLAGLTGAPPLAVIPFLETPSDHRRRLAILAAKAAFVVGGMATAVGIAVAG